MSTDQDVFGAPSDFPEEILRSLEGDTSPEVEKAVNEWLRRSPANAAELREFAKVWQLSRTPDAKDGWPELEARINELERARSRAPQLPLSYSQSRQRWVPLSAAAALVLGIGLGWFGLHKWQSRGGMQHARVIMPAGSQSNVELPGGVHVRLNYKSELTYAPSNDVREIYLKGEAYIAVPDGARRNFLVHTEAGVIRDFGTEFNVRARSGRTSVVVTEGTVRLETPRGEVMLQAGQESHVALGGVPAAAAAVNPETAIGWLSRQLTFYNQPLSYVVQELEYRYGVAFQIRDAKTRETRITAKISAEASAADAAEVICVAVQARCRREGEQWLISAR